MKKIVSHICSAAKTLKTFGNKNYIFILVFALAGLAVRSLVFSHLCDETIEIRFSEPIPYHEFNAIKAGKRTFKRTSDCSFECEHRVYIQPKQFYFQLPRKQYKISIYQKWPLFKRRLIGTRTLRPETMSCQIVTPVKKINHCMKQAAWIADIFGWLIFALGIMACAVPKVRSFFAKMSQIDMRRHTRPISKWLLPGLFVTLGCFVIGTAVILAYYHCYDQKLEVSVNFSKPVKIDNRAQYISFRKNFRHDAYFASDIVAHTPRQISALIPSLSGTVSIKATNKQIAVLESIQIGNKIIDKNIISQYFVLPRGQISGAITIANLETFAFYKKTLQALRIRVFFCGMLSLLFGMIYQAWWILRRRMKKSSGKTVLALLFSVVILFFCAKYLYAFISVLRGFPNDGDSAEIMGVAAHWLIGKKLYDITVTTDITVLGPLYLWAKYITSSYFGVRIFSMIYILFLQCLVVAMTMLTRKLSLAARIFISACSIAVFYIVFGPPNKVFMIMGEQYYCLFVIAAAICFFGYRRNWFNVLLATFFAVAAIYCKMAAKLMIFVLFVGGIFFLCNWSHFFTRRNLSRIIRFASPYLLAFVLWSFVFTLHHGWLKSTAGMCSHMDFAAEQIGMTNGGIGYGRSTFNELSKHALRVWEHNWSSVDRFKVYFLVFIVFYTLFCRKRIHPTARLGLFLILAGVPIRIVAINTLFLNPARWVWPAEVVFLFGCAVMLVAHSLPRFLRIIAGLFLLVALIQMPKLFENRVRQNIPVATRNINSVSDMEDFVLKHAENDDITWIKPPRFKIFDFYWIVLRNVPDRRIVDLNANKYKVYDESSPTCLFPIQKSWIRNTMLPNFKHVWFQNDYYVVYSNKPFPDSRNH